MRKGARWIREAAVAADPGEQAVTTDSGRVLRHDYLVRAPGIQLDFDKLPGLTEALVAAQALRASRDAPAPHAARACLLTPDSGTLAARPVRRVPG